MATPVRHILGVQFDGLGSDTTKADGLVFFWGRDEPVTGTREWWRALTGPPAPIVSSTNPWTGDWSAGAAPITLSASDRVAALLMKEQRVSSGSLSFGASASATTLFVSGDDLPTTGEVFWIGEEAIFVVSASGGNLSVQRGYWGTTASQYSAGEVFYTGLPYWRGRVVRIIVQALNTDGTSEIFEKWRGIVTDIRMVEGTIQVDAQGLLNALRTGSVGGETRPLANNLLWYPNTAQVISGSVSPFLPVLSDPSSGDTVALQVDGALLAFTDWGSHASPTSAPLLLGSAPPEERADEQEPIPVEEAREVLAWVRDLTALDSGVAPDLTVTAPFHPVSIALQLLTSTGTGSNGSYDTLAAVASLALPVDLLDGWEGVITDTPTLAIDRLILGWDGEMWEPFEVAQRILRPFGFFIGDGPDGRLVLGRLRLLELADTIASNGANFLRNQPVRLERNLASSPAEVRAVVGALPWTDGQSITVREVERSRATARLLDQRQVELDLSLFDPQRVSQDGVLDPVTSALVGLLTLGVDTAPTLWGHVPDPDVVAGLTDLRLGAVLSVDDLGNLQDPWLVGPDGIRVALSAGEIRWSGLLVSRGWDALTNTYQVGVILMNWRAGAAVLERAPSARVTTGATTSVIQLDATENHGSTPGAAFEAGDQIAVVTRRGVLRDTRTVTARTATTLTLNTALGFTPDEGDVVRLADSVSYGNDARYTGVPRPYAFVDATGATGVEDVDGNITGPDVYGTRVFAGGGDTAPTDVEFIGLDDEAVGVTDETDADPYDQWLATTMRDNESRLIQWGSQVSWVPIVHDAGEWDAGTGHRPYASHLRSTILHVPWLVQAGLDSIQASVVGQVNTQTGNATEESAAQYELTLEFGGASDRARDGVSGWEEFTLTADPPSTPTALTVTPVTLWGESSTNHWEESAGEDSAMESTPRSLEVASGTLFQDTSSTRPNADALDLQVTELAGGELFEHIKEDSDTEMVAFGSPRPSGLGVLRYLPYFQCLGVELQETFRDETYTPDSELASRQAVLAEADVLRLTRETRAHARSRCIHVGPRGDRPGETETDIWPADYTRRWVVHNAVDSLSDSLVQEMSVDLREAAPNVGLMAYVMPLHYLATRQVWPRPLELASIANWDVWLATHQLESGDTSWADAASRGSGSGSKARLPFAHTPAVFSEEWPALMSHHMRREGGAWVFREGQLFDADMPLIQPLGVAVDLTGVDTDYPVRVQLHAEFVDVDWVAASNRNNSGLDLVFVGYSLWEHT